MSAQCKNEWEEYSKNYNLLSDKIMEAGIDIKLLTDLLQSYENFSRTLDVSKTSNKL